MFERLFRLARAWRPAAIAAAVLFAAAAPARPQSAREYAIKASFIAKFVAFVKWPPKASGEPAPATPEPFTVAIFGPNPFREELEIALRKAALPGSAIRVRTVGDVKDLAGSRLIFISGKEKERLGEILGWAKANGALTVGDGEGFAGKGVIINFYPAGGRIRFEINPAAAERSGFQISSLLLKVARIVEDR